jgi:hypothetical protein
MDRGARRDCFPDGLSADTEELSDVSELRFGTSSGTKTGRLDLRPVVADWAGGSSLLLCSGAAGDDSSESETDDSRGGKASPGDWPASSPTSPEEGARMGDSSWLRDSRDSWERASTEHSARSS